MGGCYGCRRVQFQCESYKDLEEKINEVNQHINKKEHYVLYNTPDKKNAINYLTNFPRFTDFKVLNEKKFDPEICSLCEDLYTYFDEKYFDANDLEPVKKAYQSLITKIEELEFNTMNDTTKGNRGVSSDQSNTVQTAIVAK